MGNFPENLRTIRQRKGLTQCELGKITGLTNQQIYRYEKGENDPSIVVLEWLCQALGVSSKELLGF